MSITFLLNYMMVWQENISIEIPLHRKFWEKVTIGLHYLEMHMHMIENVKSAKWMRVKKGVLHSHFSLLQFKIPSNNGDYM